MKKIACGILLSLSLFAQQSFAEMVGLAGYYVGLVEINAENGSYVIITVKDAAGSKVGRFCDAPPQSREENRFSRSVVGIP